MKYFLPTKYNIISNNKNLFDIINEGYSIELGNIDLNLSEHLLNGEEIPLSSITSLLLTPSGNGNITGKDNEEIKIQFNYLFNQIMSSSSTIIIFTFGTISYYEDIKEKKAALIFYPVQYKKQTDTIQLIETPFLNVALLTKLVDLKYLTINQKKRIEKNFENINTITDIDDMLLHLVSYIKISVGTTSYLTTVRIDYPEEYFDYEKFSIIKGIHEEHVLPFLTNYYNKVHEITPLNIEQKYALSKVHNGESICIDGAFGSGKTETVINIIADQLYENKKILYVNKCKKEINNLKRRLTNLHLENFIFDGTTNLEDYKSNNSFELTKVQNNNEFMFSNIELFGKSYHRYHYFEILKELVCLNNSKDLYSFEIEPILEKPEIEDICSILDNIEKYLNNITVIKDNVWSNLQTQYNKTAPKELKETINSFYNLSINYFDKVNQLTTKNHLKPITYFSEITRLDQIVDTLSFVQPLSIWFEDNFFEDAYQSIKEIEELIKKNDNLNIFYDNYINRNYKHGSMKELYNNLNLHDVNLINKILSNQSKIEELFNRINNLINSINNSKKIFNKYFNIGNIDKNYQFYLDLYRYLSKNSHINVSWSKEYCSNKKEYYNNHSAFIKYYNIYLESKNKLKYYNFLLNDYLNIDITLSDKKILKSLNVKISKQEEIANVVKDIKDAVKAASDLITNFPYEIEDNNKIDLELNYYYNFLKFISTFNDNKDNNYSELFVLYLKNKQYLNNPINNEIYNNLRLFTFNYETLYEVINTLNYFNININTTTIVTSLNEIKDNIPLLEKYIKFKKETYNNFISNKLTVDDILTLINKDEESDDERTLLLAKEERFKSLFGDMYKGVDTKTEEILKVISSFRIYKSLLVKDYNYKEENIENIIKTLIIETKKIRGLKNNWDHLFRKTFSFYINPDFKFINKSFDKILQTIKDHIDKFDELDNTFIVVDNIKKLKTYGLYKLINKIVNGEVTNNLKDSFKLSIFNKYFTNLVKTDADFSIQLLMEEVENNKEYEKNLCNNNLYNLVKRYRSKGISIINKLMSYSTNNQSLINIYKRPIGKKLILVDNYTFIDINEIVSNYDLVIIDDAHVSTISKYGSLDFKQQLVILGDRESKYSYFNGLLNRIPKERMIHFNKRYYDINEELNNQINNKNQYIYNPKNMVIIDHFETYEEISKKVALSFIKDDKYIVVKTLDDNLSIKIYRGVIQALIDLNIDINEELLYKLSNHLQIGKSYDDVDYYADELYLLTEHVLSLDDYQKYLEIKNNRTKKLIICTFSSDAKSIYENYKLISKHENREIQKDTVEYQIYQALDKKGIKVIPARRSSGLLNLIIPTTKSIIGILIVDENVQTSYYFTDEYNYLDTMFKKYHWNLITLSMYDIYMDIDKVINNIISIYHSGE